MLTRSLSAKLMFFVTGIFLTSMLVFAYYSVTTQKADMLREVTRSVDRFCDTIARSTRYDMLRNNSEGAREIMREVGAQEAVVMVRTFNKEGEITFSTNEDEIGTLVDKDMEACYLCHAVKKPLTRLSTTKRSRVFDGRDGKRVLAMILPIYNEPDCSDAACHAHPREQKVLGVLDVGMSLQAVDKEIWTNTLRMIVFTAFIGIVIATAVGIFIQKYVHKPVRELREGMAVVASGDLDHVVQIDSSGEIGDLARSFNKMTKDLKRVQEHMIISQKLASIGTLSAAIAHELNSPLTSIYTMLEMLSRDAPQQGQLRTDLEFVLREVMRCTEIVRRLLEFTRRSKPEKTKVNVRLLIKETVKILEHQAYLRNVEIKSELASDIPEIYADADQLKQVLLNLILNAIQAIQEKGVVTVKAEKKGAKSLVLQVIDTGCGIPKEMQKTAFEPFFTTKEPGVGTGLGLAISKDIIDMHGGKIKLESEMGLGTRISIELPL